MPRQRFPLTVHRALAACGSVVLVLASGCGSGQATSGSSGDESIVLSPQRPEYLIGADRVSFAITDLSQSPVLGATGTVDLQRRDGTRLGSTALTFVGGEDYGGIPVYRTIVDFPATGELEFVAHVSEADGSAHSGHAFITVSTSSPELPVGHPVSEVKQLKQQIASDVGGDLTKIDSGTLDGKPAPDPWHDHTVQDGLAQHHPMILYFGTPARCTSRTCGPTVLELGRIFPEFRDQFWFEHIEEYVPADSQAFNPVFLAFGLQTEPWVYFVNAQGVVADRFEGPVTSDQLRQAARGTLAGNVPAVGLQPG